MDLKQFDFLIAGQLKTSRTETLENYLSPRVRSLGVVGFMSPFASYNESRSTLYEGGIKTKNRPLPSFSIKGVTGWKRPLMCISFIIYIFSTFLAVKRLSGKFDYFIGIATFSAMMGVFLRKLKIVKKVIYYCIDYYPPPKKLGFNKLENIIYRNIDVWLLKRADILWEISPRIKEARQRYMEVSQDSYNPIIVPLGYDNGIHRDCPLDKKERWTLGFVGTLSENQGLQMVIEAMPHLIKRFPEIKVRVIGHGPYALYLKDLAQRFNVQDRFIFHGFIKDDTQVYDILSRCMVGLATWTGDESDNSLYADPGKPKLYALLGLPIIITSAPYVSKVISATGAGEVIDYDIDNFISALDKIVGDTKGFLSYKEGLKRFKPYCLAENIFNQAFTRM